MKTKTKQRGRVYRTEYRQSLGKNSLDIARDVWNYIPVFENLHSCIPGISKFALIYSTISRGTHMMFHGTQIGNH
jgi:hypothetical protein